MHRRFSWHLMALLAIVSMSAACAKQTGTRGELIFMYESPGDPFDFNKPIASGQTLELFVHRVVDERPVEIIAVRSSRDDVLEVTGQVAHLFGVKARRKGRANIMVRAKDDQGNIYIDTVTLRVDTIDRMALHHSCQTMQREEGSGKPPLYLENSRDLFVPWTRISAKHELLLGYGEFPVSISPEGAASVRTNRTSQAGMSIDIHGNPKRFSIKSDHGDHTLDFEVTSAADVDAVWMPEWDREAWGLVGQSTWTYVEPQVAGRPLCQHELALDAKSLTPDVCQARVVDLDGFIQITGKRWGICRYEVRYPQGKASARAEFTARIGKLPEGDGEGGEGARVPWWLAPLLALLVPVLTAPVLVIKYRRR